MPLLITRHPRRAALRRQIPAGTVVNSASAHASIDAPGAGDTRDGGGGSDGSDGSDGGDGGDRGDREMQLNTRGSRPMRAPGLS
jgi:hypothetical protein